MTNLEFATELRKLAAMYEANPDIPQVHGMSDGVEMIFCHSKQDFTQTVKAILGAFGSGTKSEDEDGLIFTPNNTALTIRVFGFKNGICKRVKVGERTIPATEEQVIPAHPERTEDIYKYECVPFLEDAQA